jgi:hypothetical protein
VFVLAAENNRSSIPDRSADFDHAAGSSASGATDLRFPIKDPRWPLAEGITAKHLTMPQFRLDADQILDLLTYLKTLEP